MKGFIKNPPKDQDPLAGDLSELIGKAQWRKVRFVLAPKDTTVTIRMSKGMLDTAKKVAKKRGIKYHRLMRDAIANYLVKAA